MVSEILLQHFTLKYYLNINTTKVMYNMGK